MKKQANQAQTRIYKIYLPHERQWVEVTEQQYYAYYREIWAIRKRAQAHHQCMCPKNKHWLCDGDCLICQFHAPGDNLSLDLTYKNSNGEEYSMKISDWWLSHRKPKSLSVSTENTSRVPVCLRFLADWKPTAY